MAPLNISIALAMPFLYDFPPHILNPIQHEVLYLVCGEEPSLGNAGLLNSTGEGEELHHLPQSLLWMLASGTAGSTALTGAIVPQQWLMG